MNTQTFITWAASFGVTFLLTRDVGIASIALMVSVGLTIIFNMFNRY